MIDVSIVARKSKIDPYSPEVPFQGPEQPVRGAGKASLTDRQASILGDFIVKHLPRRQHESFRLAVLSRLTAGMVGGAALRRAMMLAALEHGFSHEKVTALGLAMERSNKRNGITD
jgi:hypothetical protein